MREISEDRYWEGLINEYDPCFNAIPWFKKNIGTKFKHNIVWRIKSLYEAYFDKSTGPNIISDDLIADMNESFFKHSFVASKSFNQDGFSIAEVLGVIGENIAQNKDLNTEEHDFVVDACNAIMVCFGLSMIDFDLNRIKGRWCENKEIESLIEEIKSKHSNLEKTENDFLI